MRNIEREMLCVDAVVMVEDWDMRADRYNDNPKILSLCLESR